MIPAFDYHRASTVEEALGAAAAGAVPLAGGHSLLVDMKRRRRSPSAVVDISGLAPLRTLEIVDGELLLGAAVTYARLERSALVRRLSPVLAHSASTVGDRQVRALGTVGGSVVNADPAADLPAALLALDAVYVLHSAAGTRTVPARDLQTGPGTTVLAPGELLVQIRVPVTRDSRWSYQKFRQRSHQWAVIGVVAVAGPDATRIALMGMGPTSVRARAAERMLAEGATRHDAAAAAPYDLDVPDDHRGSVRYRRHLAQVLTARALDEIDVG